MRVEKVSVRELNQKESVVVVKTDESLAEVRACTMKNQALVNVACALNSTHAFEFAAIMVGFKLELTEATENEAFAYLSISIRNMLLDFFRTLKHKNVLSNSIYRQHKERCLFLFEQILKSASSIEYSEALCEHICELQRVFWINLKK